MANADRKYSDLTQTIIGCAMKVHRHFGVGFPEIVYKKALMIELDEAGITYRSEVEKGIFYKGKLIHTRRLDLIVEEVVIVELKALKELENRDIVQSLNYLKIFCIEVGLLFNFGACSLFFKRLINSAKD